MKLKADISSAIKSGQIQKLPTVGMELAARERAIEDQAIMQYFQWGPISHEAIKA